jgi:two-component system sensor histidine kinase HydH
MYKTAEDRAVMQAERQWPVEKPFNLIRSFSLLSLASIAVFSTVVAIVLSNFMIKETLQRDAEVTSHFVRAAFASQADIRYLEAGGRKPLVTPTEMEEFFEETSQLPDVLLTNVFARDRTIIWSSNPELVGKRFAENDELEEAFTSKLVVEHGITVGETHKQEQRFVGGGPKTYFVENYIPVLDPGTGRVAGVVEVYKKPRTLFQALERGVNLIWLCTAIGAVALYMVLFWIVRRAHSTMAKQQTKLLDSEAFVVIGEMASAVAHSIRSPLSSIRSSAELAIDGNLLTMRDAAQDIMAECDRLEKWVRELLTYSRPLSGNAEKVQLAEVVQESLKRYERDMEKDRIAVEGAPGQGEWDLPPVEGNGPLLVQVMNTLFQNAMEAMPEGGKLTIGHQVQQGGKHVVLSIADTGVGIPKNRVEQVFSPLYTTKYKGLGIGLPLAKRIVERFGGRIEISSEPGRGTTVHLTFCRQS